MCVMANRVVGVDTAFAVTENLITSATTALGQPPQFWGRYFTNRSTQGPVEYHHVVENAVLAAHGIRVLPVARQTNKVGRAEEDGQSDGAANGEDLIATFGADYLAEQGGEFFVFLDVEGSGSSHLSADYYTGWTRGLAGVSDAVSFLPCVYGIPGDALTWTALARAMAGGAACHGLWMAHPLRKAAEPVAWNERAVTPIVDPGAPVLLWQYMFAGDGVPVDRDMVNPALDPQEDLLPFLIAPPS
jgi:hypothetical protein